MISSSGSIAWARTQRWGRVRRGRTGGAAARTVCACSFPGREASGSGSRDGTEHKKCHSQTQAGASGESVDVVDGAARACARPWPQTISTRARARAWHPTASRPRDSTTPTPHAIDRDRRGAGRGVRVGVVRAGARLRPPQLPGSSGASRGARFFLWRRRAARLTAHSRHARVCDWGGAGSGRT
jgi:hypothetical protein